jgi:hypothetical protein
MSTVPSGTRFIGIAESVNLTERKSAVLNTETQPYTIQDIADTVGVGAQGPQGVQGPAGPLGPVGPAGLNWQGAWVSGTSYVADDAVGYGGASYFCILATSGTTTPNLATTNWALLASQGAQGIQGVQGPTGAQGASGAQVTKVLKTTITSTQILNLFTTPITVLDAFTPNLKYPINIYIRRNIGNGYTLANNMFSIVDEANVVVENSIDASFLVFNYSSNTGFTQKSLSIDVSSGNEDRRYSYKLKANVGNPTLGTGNFDVYVTYIEITL